MSDLENQTVLDAAADATQCDSAPIHLFGKIQSHGALIGFTWPDQRIQVISNNAPAFFDRAQQEILGSKLDYVFDTEFVKCISDQVQLHPWVSAGKPLDVNARTGEGVFDSFLYESDGLFIIELERAEVDVGLTSEDAEAREFLRAFSLEARSQTTVVELSKLVCRTIRAITGLDRVMMYKFVPPHWYGEVIAEDRKTSAHSYLSHRFPATDIPRPARELYLRNQVRLISDVNAPNVDLFPKLNPKTQKPIDLKDSRLRSAAPIHNEYLKNMGVGASFSVAVTGGEHLWGLITCHHLRPLRISQKKRSLCEIVAHVCSAQVQLIERNQNLNEQIEFDFRLRKVFENLLRSKDPIDQFFRQHRTVTEAFSATAIALVGEELKDFAGLTPLKSDLLDLKKWLQAKMDTEQSETLAIDSLATLDPKWEPIKKYVSGVLAVRLPEMDNAILMILRPELLRDISWGGDPRKNLDKRNFQGAIHPRQSFETWQQTIQLHSAPWESFEVEGIKFLRDAVFDSLLARIK